MAELTVVQRASVLRACIAQKDSMRRDLMSLEHQPGMTAQQAAVILNAQLAVLDSAISTLWLDMLGMPYAAAL